VKIGIIGVGAVGGYYGGLLVKSGYDVRFLLRSDYEYVRKNGLLVESKNGDFSLEEINVYSEPENMPLCDIVIIALKTTHNKHLKTILPAIVKKDGIVVALQNGLGVENDISEIVPSASIIGGLCFLCSNKIGPGHIRHLDYGSIRFGQYSDKHSPAGVTDQLKQISEIFTKATVPVHVADDLGLARWEKLVWNIGFNGLTVILNASTDQIMKNKSSANLVKDLMLEVIKGAQACGYSIKDNFAEIMLTATREMIDYKPSMKLDYEAGRQLETNSIYWRPIREAEKNDYLMHKTKVLAFQLDFLDRFNR